jgi:uncharacterized membrane protein YtjA (UPF0391 family)
MPLQVALIAPLVKLGRWLTPTLAAQQRDFSLLLHSPVATALHAPGSVLGQLGVMAGQALVAWLLFAVPVALLLTIMLTGVLRRVAERTAQVNDSTA